MASLNPPPTFDSVYATLDAVYELSDDKLRVTTRREQRETTFSELVEMNLRYLGTERHVCTLVAGGGQRFRFCGTTTRYGTYAQFIGEMHRRLEPFNSRIRFTSGNILHFSLALVAVGGLVLSMAVAVVELCNGVPVMTGGGWGLAVPLFLGLYFLERMVSVIWRDLPRRYKPYERRYPYFISLYLLYSGGIREGLCPLDE